jgi:hypothetical protein
MARAFVYEGVHIEVFKDRVATGKTGIDPVLLAHVMVHEITHILEGVARHSRSGVMKAQWTQEDYVRMHYSPIGFAAEDIELIQLGMLRRQARNAALSCDLGCSLASR